MGYNELNLKRVEELGLRGTELLSVQMVLIDFSFCGAHEGLKEAVFAFEAFIAINVKFSCDNVCYHFEKAARSSAEVGMYTQIEYTTSWILEHVSA